MSLILSQGEWACWGIRLGLWVAQKMEGTEGWTAREGVRMSKTLSGGHSEGGEPAVAVDNNGSMRSIQSDSLTFF